MGIWVPKESGIWMVKSYPIAKLIDGWNGRDCGSIPDLLGYQLKNFSHQLKLRLSRTKDIKISKKWGSEYKRVWYLNGQKLSDRQIVWCLNAIWILDYHLNNVDLNKWLLTVRYSDVSYSDPHCLLSTWETFQDQGPSASPVKGFRFSKIEK